MKKDRQLRRNLKLQKAIQDGHVYRVKKLIKLITKTNPKKNEIEKTRLFAAVLNGKSKMVQTLINKGAKVNVTNNYGHFPILYAVIYDHTDICKYLLQKGSIVDKCDNNADIPTLLYWAVARGNLELVQCLIQAGANINKGKSNGTTPLFRAIAGNKYQIFRCLLDAGADVNKIPILGYTTLMEAAHRRNSNFLEDLIKAGADIHAKCEFFEYTALDEAVMSQRIRNVVMLLEAGASINTKNSSGTTILMFAALSGTVAIVKVLLKAGADIHAKNEAGETALTLAIQRGCADIIKFLIKAGSIVDDKDFSGQTLLSHATLSLEPACIKILIEAGVDLDTKDEEGNVPSTLAALTLLRRNYGDIDSLKYLLEVVSHIDLCKLLEYRLRYADHFELYEMMIKYFVLLNPLACKPHLDPVSLSDWWDSCLSQVRRMQSYHLDRSGATTVHDYLSARGRSRRAGFLYNDDTGSQQEQALCWSKENVPIYADMVEEHIAEDMKRGKLLLNWNTGMRKLAFRQVSTGIRIKIGEQLTNGDLESFVNK